MVGSWIERLEMEWKGVGKLVVWIGWKISGVDWLGDIEIDLASTECSIKNDIPKISYS